MPDIVDVYLGTWFALEVSGKVAASAGFTKCGGLGSDTEVVEQKVVDTAGKEVRRKVPGRLNWEDIKMSQGVTSDMSLYKWRQEIVDGKVDSARANGSVIVYSADGTEIARWNFVNGWPSSLTSSELSAESGQALIQDLTIVHEGIERAK